MKYSEKPLHFHVSSCKELKTKCSFCKSGIYEIDFDQPTTVYCDLETDGGKYFYIQLCIKIFPSNF